METDESTTKKDLRKKIEDYEAIFEKLRPFVVLAIDDYYVGQDREELESKITDLGYNLP